MTTPTTTTTSTQQAINHEGAISLERKDLLETLTKHRFFLTFAAQGLTDEQAGLTPTVSELCIGGLIKHTGQTEKQWAAFIVNGRRSVSTRPSTKQRSPNGQTVSGCCRTTRWPACSPTMQRSRRQPMNSCAHCPTWDAAHALPEAPWFEAGASWSARRTLMHVIAETAQHAGHADIVREAIDGQKSMG